VALTYSTQLSRLKEQLGDLVQQREGRDLSEYARYADDPVGFIREVLKGDPWSMQEEIAEAVRDNPLTVVRSCNAAGKDWIASHLALWILYARQNLVLITGPTERQVREIVMNEVGRAFRRADDLPGELYQLALRVPNTEHAGILAFTSSEASKLTGFHAPRVMAILTEAQACEAFAWEGLLACTTGSEDRVLAVGNPLSPDGRFYTVSRPNSDWRSIRISAQDHPNVVEGDPTIVRGGVTRDFINRIRREYGEASPIYIARVLGEFPESSDDALVRRSWLEAAADRWENGTLADQAYGAEPVVAVDVARFGSDSSVMCFRSGPVVKEFVEWKGFDLMTSTGRVIEELRNRFLERADPRYGPGIGGKPYQLVVDEIGLGSGLLDRLREQRIEAIAFNSSHRARNPERFANRRAEAFWTVRRTLERGEIALPRDDELFEELVSIRWSVESSGKIKLERKKETRDRIGRSPDRADAVAMAFAEEETCTVGGEMFDI